MKKAFTLIELLIVVAIIAILAAIAVPNFLEAQTRSKVSRVKADHRTVALPLEAYFIDWNTYPACHRFGIMTREIDPVSGAPADPSEPIVLERLTTPVAYISNIIIQDPFIIKGRLSAADADGITTDDPTFVNSGNDAVARLNTYIYQAFNNEGRFQTQPDSFDNAFDGKASGWILHSAGPDTFYHNLGGVLANDYTIDGPINLQYDASNGTISFGSVYRGSENRPGANSPVYAAGQGLLEAAKAAQ